MLSKIPANGFAVGEGHALVGDGLFESFSYWANCVARSARGASELGASDFTVSTSESPWSGAPLRS